MEHDQGADIGIDGKLPYLGDERVAPAMFVRHIFFCVLRIMDQYIDA
jgi:hypothetical protein